MCLLTIGGCSAMKVVGNVASGIAGSPATINLVLDVFGKMNQTTKLKSLTSPDSGVTSLRIIGIVGIERGNNDIECVLYHVKCDVSRAHYLVVIERTSTTFYYLNDLTKVIKKIKE